MKTTVALLALALALAACAAPAQAASFDAVQPVFGAPHAVTYDKYTMKVDGQRLPVWSAEVHFWRLPSPGLWRDMLEKVKASGYNTISIYVDWGLTSPAPGREDLTGVNDLDRFLTIAEQIGLYVIARPGPYINSEVDGGGLPPWLLNVGASRNRPASPEYTKAWREYWDAVVPIIARHQITRGGSVFLFQIENEYGGKLNSDQTVSAADSETYIRSLVTRTRELGIDVPLTWNIQTDTDTYPDVIPIGGKDGYPHLQQLLAGCTAGPEAMTTPGADVYNPESPIFTPEFEGGSMTYWGSPAADACYRMTAPPIQRMMDQTLLADGETMTNQYMGYGGTNWGWLAMPSTITSYDWGTAIDEARELTPKSYEQKQFGYRWASFPDLSVTDAADKPAGSNSDLLLALRRNPDTKAQVIFLRHEKVSDTSTGETTLSLSLPDGDYPRVPQDPAQQIQIAGQDSKMLLAAANVRGQRLVYSTSEPYLAATIDDRDFAGFVGRHAEAGETVLRYAARPEVTVLAGKVQTDWNAERGDLRLDYVHDGLARVLITGGGRRPLVLLLADDDAAAGLWLTNAGTAPVLTIGPYVVKHAALQGERLDLAGQTAARLPKLGDVGGATTTSAWSGNLESGAPDTPLEVFAPSAVRGVRWNGTPVEVAGTDQRSLRGSVPGPPAVHLPKLNDWRFHSDIGEADPKFDDRGWTSIPAGGDLSSDAYGFHHGNVWYRGHFTATGTETSAVIRAFTGGAPAGVMAWLNGQYVGSSTDTSMHAYPSADSSVAVTIPLTSALRVGENNVLSILVEGSHPILGVSANGKDDQQTRLGLESVTFAGAPSTVSWKLQGTLGGARPADTLRGAFNNGGLGGERNGWTERGFDDASWPTVRLPDAWSARGVPAGVGWYRTRFSLDLPQGADIPLGVRIDDDASRDYEALIFANGWMVGRYANALGPQHLFSIPEGLLDHHGANDLAIAVLSRGATNTAGLGTVALQAYGRYGGSAFSQADAAAAFGRPAARPAPCAKSARIAGVRLGRLRLGLTPAQALRRVAPARIRRRGPVDLVCSGSRRLRIGYAADAKLLRALPSPLRRRVSGRIVLLSTTRTTSSVAGVRPGARIARVAPTAGLRRVIRGGGADWYVVSRRRARGVLRVRGGRVVEVGIVDRRLAAKRSWVARLLRSVR